MLFECGEALSYVRAHVHIHNRSGLAAWARRPTNNKRTTSRIPSFAASFCCCLDVLVVVAVVVVCAVVVRWRTNQWLLS